LSMCLCFYDPYAVQFNRSVFRSPIFGTSIRGSTISQLFILFSVSKRSKIMEVLRRKKLLLVISVLVAAVFVLQCAGKHEPVDFTTQVKPILNKNCISCHGGVRQKGGFSLLFRDEALAKTKSGKYAIIPGDPGHSEMIRRITLDDPEDRMPYKHDPLSKNDIDILRRWIKEGAKWGEHWAYVPVKDVPVPQNKSGWTKNAIDNFIAQKLDEQDLKPSTVADKQTLLRRVSLDIIGMPAPESLAKKYLNDNSDHAYADLVDSLLASPHYGEKWAAMWLDLARYADTKGYERDDARTIWRYRDWLINAFNNDKPYDQFLTEQLAGDLLPNATDDDFIATAFHRNTMTNDEGGTENEEFRTAAVLDRVNTTWQALMGTTFGCVQCHSHPYDPFHHEDYYKFMAFFNDTRDEDTEADYPLLRTYNDSLQQQLSLVVNWIKENVSAKKEKEVYTFLKTWQPAYNSLICDSFTNSELTDTKWLAFRNHAVSRLKNVDLTNKNSLIYRFLSWPRGGGTWNIHLDNISGPVIASTSFASAKKDMGWQYAETALQPTNGAHDLVFTYNNPTITDSLLNAVIFDWYYFTETFPGNDKPGYAAIKNNYWKLLKADLPTTPVMMDNPTDMHRPTNVFERGNWLVKGDKVTADVPQSLNPFPANAPRNRLGLAMWLTSKQNPLTARTMVNRVWEQLFGNGLAETLEDLGSQGVLPTHPELLDWLSYQFMNDDNWSVKKMIRTIVMSATYQQDSKVSPELLQKDPANKYYARGARVRLSAEQIRDQALFISGVFCDSMYGPSVYPWQPKGIWLSPWNGRRWEQSKGNQQYRRALYTYWKRTAGYPSMMTFDGVSREVCSARRIRTNTPLQALTTLNDSVYIDLARHFAQRMQKEAGTEVKQQIRQGFEWATNHAIDDKSLQALMKLYNTAFSQFKNNKDKTSKILGETNKDASVETAALTVVANAILNLDEVVTKN
jgi:mono/diheme cytochrome c family protein